jgi:hypothetical protein
MCEGMPPKRKCIHSVRLAEVSCEQALREGIEDMMIQVERGVRIENPREYERCAVNQLRQLLELGSSAQLDPRRPNFYDIDSNGENYYFHISPVSGNVVLLARWLRQPEDCCISSGHLAA